EQALHDHRQSRLLADPGHVIPGQPGQIPLAIGGSSGARFGSGGAVRSLAPDLSVGEAAIADAGVGAVDREAEGIVTSVFDAAEHVPLPVAIAVDVELVDHRPA